MGQRASKRFWVLLAIVLAGFAASLAMMGFMAHRQRLAKAALEEGLAQIRGDINGLQEGMAARLDAQAQAHAAAAAMLGESIGLNRQGVERADGRLGRLERAYGELLAEQRKRTLAGPHEENALQDMASLPRYRREGRGLYDENALLDMEREAAGLFLQGQYRQAHELYAMVAQTQTDNLEARFFQHYSLFLLNRNDRDQYRAIRNGLLQLDRNGYRHPDLLGVLAYMDTEEGKTEAVGGTAGE
jgi:hypothetical protein